MPSTGYFQIIPRSRRAKQAIAIVRQRSRQFKQALAADDAERVEKISSSAWNALTNLFETLRNERDHHYLSRSELQAAVGWLVEPISQPDQSKMVTARKVDRSRSECQPLSLNEALNKLGHYDGRASTYRVDGRGAHYLILGGQLRKTRWMAEILVSRLCDEAASAAKAIRQHPMSAETGQPFTPIDELFPPNR